MDHLHVLELLALVSTHLLCLLQVVTIPTNKPMRRIDHTSCLYLDNMQKMMRVRGKRSPILSCALCTN